MKTLGEERLPLRQEVADILRRRITDRELLPGAKLVEHLLAEELGVSRNPVREALLILESEGFVTTLPRRGVVVRNIDERTVRELFEIRAGLEAMAARLAAARVASGEEDCARLREIVDASRTATDSGDLTEVSRLNQAFHVEIVRMTGNRALAELMRPVLWRIRWVFRVSAETRAPHSWTEHLELLKALSQGDPDAAREAALEHVQRAGAAAVEHLD